MRVGSTHRVYQVPPYLSNTLFHLTGKFLWFSASVENTNLYLKHEYHHVSYKQLLGLDQPKEREKSDQESSFAWGKIVQSMQFSDWRGAKIKLKLLTNFREIGYWHFSLWSFFIVLQLFILFPIFMLQFEWRDFKKYKQMYEKLLKSISWIVLKFSGPIYLCKMT